MRPWINRLKALERRLFGESKTLTRRVIFATMVWGIIVLIGGGATLTTLYQLQTLRLLDDELSVTLTTLNRSIAYDGTGHLEKGMRTKPSDANYNTPLSGKYWAIITLDANEKPIRTLTSDSIWDGDIPLSRALEKRALANAGQAVFANATGPANDDIRVGTLAILVEGGEYALILLAARDRTKWDETTRDFRNLAMTAMLILFCSVMAAMLTQIRVSLRPLNLMQKDIAAIRAGKQDRLIESYPTELRAVTSELNLLIAHNHEVVERARTHVGNLAHALKTPIAVLQNEARGRSALDKLVRDQAKIMHENVNSHLRRARAAAGAKALGARTEINPIIQGLVRTLEKIFAERKISISTQLTSDVVFRGEKQDFEEAIGNLLENACKWTARQVRVSTEIDGHTFTVYIDDDGPGLEPAQRIKALKRGERLDESAPGSGLGLSIVTDLASIYDGDFKLEESPLGGLRASLTLPKIP